MEEVKKFFDMTRTKFAVAYSPGYGAGFSTWAPEYPTLAYDRRVISYILYKMDGDGEWCRLASTSGTPEHEDFKNTLSYWGYNDVYLGGVDSLTIKWIVNGSYWRINEYDGYESIEILEDDPYAGWNR